MSDTARTGLGPFAGHGAAFRVETADPVLAELLSRSSARPAACRDRP